MDFATLKALTNIRHNGKIYLQNSIIPEIDIVSANRLVDLKSAEFYTTEPKQENHNNANNNPETADFRKGAVSRSDPARKLERDVTPATTRIIQEADMQTARAGAIPSEKSAYAEMTNTLQIEYLSSISDEDFIKSYKELENYSKSKSKAYAVKRIKKLNKE